MEIAWPPHWSRTTACAPKMSAFGSFCASVKSVHRLFRRPRWRPSARKLLRLLRMRKFACFGVSFGDGRIFTPCAGRGKMEKPDTLPLISGGAGLPPSRGACESGIPPADGCGDPRSPQWQIDGRRLSLAERRDMLVPGCGFRQNHLARGYDCLSSNMLPIWRSGLPRTISLRWRSPCLDFFRAGDYRISSPEAGCGDAHEDDGKAAPDRAGFLRPTFSQSGHRAARRFWQPDRTSAPAWSPERRQQRFGSKYKHAGSGAPAAASRSMA